MSPVLVPLAPVAACDRPTFDGMRPVPDGYSLDRLTVVRADQVRPGDLVVGDASSRVSPLAPEGQLRWVGFLAAPWVAQPGPYDADCPSCRAWMSGYEGPAVVLYPHVPERAGALIAIVPPAGPVEPAPPACVNACTCENGRIRLEHRWAPWPTCADCHGRPCAVCAAGGSH